jgi:hypothetical protein
MYHVCREKHLPGAIIPPGDDSYLERMKNPHEKQMELAIRNRSSDVAKIRDKCVFTYKDETQAINHRRIKEVKYRCQLQVYEVAIDTEDLLYQADLNHFTNGTKASANEDEDALADAVTGYLSGHSAR